jgi:hypothetical protein
MAVDFLASLKNQQKIKHSKEYEITQKGIKNKIVVYEIRFN